MSNKIENTNKKEEINLNNEENKEIIPKGQCKSGRNWKDQNAKPYYIIIN